MKNIIIKKFLQIKNKISLFEELLIFNKSPLSLSALLTAKYPPYFVYF